MANMNGALSIYCNPLDTSNEELGISIFRKIERILLNRFSKRRINLAYKEEDLRKILKE